MRRYDPFESMERLFEQMRVAGFGSPEHWGRADAPALEGGADAGVEMTTPAGRSWWMAPSMGRAGLAGRGIRLEPTDDGYVAMADLPGFEREDITVRLEDRRLSVEAAHGEDEASETARWRGSRRVQEVVDLPAGAEPVTDEVSATYRNGVLEVSIPTAGEDVDDEHVIDIE